MLKPFWMLHRAWYGQISLPVPHCYLEKKVSVTVALNCMDSIKLNGVKCTVMVVYYTY